MPGRRGDDVGSAVAHLQDRDRVRGHREERRVAEREQAGVTEQQIDREREQTEDQHLRQQRHPERADANGASERRGERDEGEDDAV